MAADNPVQITEKLLIAAGGWEAIKHARGICAMGRVSGAQWSPPLLKGFVREGETEYRAGLKIESPTRIENVCSCRVSREWGTICAHSLAVGLAYIGPGRAAPAAAAKPAALKAPELPYRAAPAATGRLHIVLAPDLLAAWRKGQLVAGLELAGGGKRAMLGSEDWTRRGALTPGDFRAVESLARIQGAVPGGMGFLSREQFLEWLDALAGHPRITLGRSAALEIQQGAMLPPLRAELAPDGSLELAVTWPAETQPLVAGGRAWLLRGGKGLQVIAPGLPAVYHSLLEEPKRLPPEQAAAFLSGEWPKLAPFFEVKSDPTAAGSAAMPIPAAVELGPPRLVLELEGSLNQLGGRLQAIYPNKRIVTVGLTPEREAFTFAMADRPGRLFSRHLPAERDAQAQLEDWGFQGPDTAGNYIVRGQDAVLRFFAQGLPMLRREWEVTLGSRFTNISRQIEVMAPEISVRGSGEDWFELEISLQGGGARFSAAEIQRLLQGGRGHTRLPDGRLAVLPAEALGDLEEVLKDCDPTQSRPGIYRIQKAHGSYLDSTFQRWSAALTPSWQDWKQRQGAISLPAPLLLPADLETALRPYQKEGVRWLSFLAENQLGGILADEMGLGKTLQALAFLASSVVGRPPRLPEKAPSQPTGAAALQSEPLPSLVVCPTSLVENWRREAARFTPSLRVLAIDGPDRAGLFGKLKKTDLAITSYALLRRDIDRYRPLNFATVILDEAHHIKNPDSQVAQAACALRSQHRFVLTGTPMENSVRDLWSIMHFALPGYLGLRQDFRDRYELPLSRPGGDPAIRDRLTRRLRPVLLRRRKKDVAAELPDRIEQTAFCDLTPAQAEVYRQLLEQSRLKLDTARRDKNKGAGRMLVLTALLRLRQACCDLRLLGLPGAAGGDAAGRATGAVALQSDEPPAESAKLALLDELLEEILEGGHRVLIFSQFVSMLKILSAHLEAAKIPFCYLDGSTKPADRSIQVDRFQSDESVTAFLISVKAGGTGLNLTGADTVIHFDPWWNPAVEAQATDRAHRIGQTRVVTAYRLIARGTVEEKIFALQNRKKELTASLVEREKDEPLLETLSFEEIEGLLA